VDLMRLGRARLKEIVNELLTAAPEVRAGQVARAASMSRQAAHRHLAAFVREGFLRAEGAGRGARYRAAARAGQRLRYRREGLSEDDVWKNAREKVPHLQGLPGNAERILHYAVTEIVNNAIDHSAATWVEVHFPPPGNLVAFEVADDGVGIFDHLRRR